MAAKRRFTVEEGLAALMDSDDNEICSEINGDSDDSLVADFQDEEGTFGQILCSISGGHGEDACYRSSMLFEDQECKVRTGFHSVSR